MRYIKTFEGFFDFLKKKPIVKNNNEVLYSEVSRQEFESTLDNHKNDDLTKSEKSFLNKYNKYRNMDIYKLTDEWFLVSINHHNISTIGGIKFFKCDTFEGLVQCLDDNKEFYSYVSIFKKMI